MLVTGDHNPCVPPDWYFRPCVTDEQIEDENYPYWSSWWSSWYGSFFWWGWTESWGASYWGPFFGSAGGVFDFCAGTVSQGGYGLSGIQAGAALMGINKWSSARWSWVTTPMELRNTDLDEWEDPQWQLACFRKEYECDVPGDPDEADLDLYTYPFIPYWWFYEKIKRYFLKCDDPFPVEQRAEYDASTWDTWWHWWNWWGDGFNCNLWWDYYTDEVDYPQTPIGGPAGVWSGAFYVCAPFKMHFAMEGTLHALGQILQVTIASPCMRDPDNLYAPFERWSRTAIVYGRVKPDTGALYPCSTCKRIKFDVDWTVSFDQYMIWRKHRPWAVSEPLLVTVQVVGQFWPEKGGVTITTEIEEPPEEDSDGDGVDDSLDEDDDDDDWGNNEDPDQIDYFPIDVEGEDGSDDDGGDGDPVFPIDDPDDPGGSNPPAPTPPPVVLPPPVTPPDADNPCCCDHALGGDGVYHGAATLTVTGFPALIECYAFVDPTQTFKHTYGNLDGKYNCVADCSTGWDLTANLGQQGVATRKGVLVETWFKVGDPDYPKQVFCYKITTSPDCFECPTDDTKVQLQGNDVTFHFHIFDSADNYEGDLTSVVATSQNRLSQCKELACDGTLVDLAEDVAIIPSSQICDPDCTAGGATPCTAAFLMFEINLNVAP